MNEPIKCKLYNHQDFIGNKDLDSSLHEGFTVRNGKQLYWFIVWSKNGIATVYGAHPGKRGNFPRRTLSPDTDITIHFKS